jgi:N-acetylglutamate synthase-like GNAT family acetyltransferase
MRTRRCWTTDGAALFAERRVAREIFLLPTLPLAPSVPELDVLQNISRMKIQTQNLKIISSGIGVISGALGILTAEGNWRTISLCALLIIVSLALYFTLSKILRHHFTTVIGDMPPPRYSIREARINDLTSIAELQRSFYPDDAVPIELYKEWYEVNPNGFFVIESKTTSKDGLEHKELVGHFTFLAIRDECMDLYREGEIRETDIRHYSLLGPDDVIKNLYVESVIVKKSHRRHAMFCLVRMLKTMVCNFCDPEVAERVYAMAATKDGEKTLKGMGFTRIERQNRKDRKDGHEMFDCSFESFMKTIIERETKHEINMLHRES